MTYVAIAVGYLLVSFAVCVLAGKTAKFMRDGTYDANEIDDQEQWEYFNPGKSSS